MLHCGGKEVSYSTVQAVKTPEPTDSHFPIPHSTLVDVSRRALTDYGYTMGEEVHALWGDNGQRYFGIIEITEGPGMTPNGHTFNLGLRSSHDKSFAPQGLLGTRVWLCDNLCWSGGDLFSYRRKSTRYIQRDLEGIVFTQLGKLGERMGLVEERYSRYRAYTFGDETRGDSIAERTRLEAHDFLMRAMRARAVSPSRIYKVLHEWDRPDGCGGHGEADDELGTPTAWRMLNAFTEVEKQYPSLLEGPKRNARLTALLDARCGLTADANILSVN